MQNYSEITKRPMIEKLGLGKLKFIKLELPTVDEAKNRATALALLTCNMWLGSNSFIRFFTGEDFRDQHYLQGTVR